MLALLSIFYYSFFLRNKEMATSTLRTYLALAPALLSLACAILLYFDQSMQMNSPAKLLALAAFVSLTFAALVECRFYAEPPKGAFRYLSLAVAFYFTMTASVPNLIYTLVHNKVLMLSSAYDFLLFAFGLYLLARLCALLPEGEKKTHALVREAAEAPTEEEAPAPTEEEAAPAPGEEEIPVEEASAPAPDEEKKPRAKKTKKKEDEAEAPQKTE